ATKNYALPSEHADLIVRKNFPGSVALGKRMPDIERRWNVYKTYDYDENDSKSCEPQKKSQNESARRSWDRTFCNGLARRPRTVLSRTVSGGRLESACVDLPGPGQV